MNRKFVQPLQANSQNVRIATLLLDLGLEDQLIAMKRYRMNVRKIIGLNHWSWCSSEQSDCIGFILLFSLDYRGFFESKTTDYSTF